MNTCATWCEGNCHTLSRGVRARASPSMPNGKKEHHPLRSAVLHAVGTGTMQCHHDTTLRSQDRPDSEHRSEVVRGAEAEIINKSPSARARDLQCSLCEGTFLSQCIVRLVAVWPLSAQSLSLRPMTPLPRSYNDSCTDNRDTSPIAHFLNSTM